MHRIAFVIAGTGLLLGSPMSHVQTLVKLCRSASLVGVFAALAIAGWMLLARLLQSKRDSIDATDRPRRLHAICLRRSVQLAIAPWAVVAFVGVMRGVSSLPQPVFALADGLVLAATCFAVLLARVGAQLSFATVYSFGLTLLGIIWIYRDYSPSRFFVWGIICDLGGFLIASALLSWSIPTIRNWTSNPRDFAGIGTESAAWFSWTQACLAVVPVGLAVWISNDVAFDGVGEGYALLGLSGRAAGWVAALILVGMAILMSWQTRGRTHIAWQFVTMFAGILFTASIGWSRIDLASLPAGESPWPDRVFTLLVSTSMMTFMTGVGLARFLPRNSDWIPRGHQAMPVFGTTAVLLLVLWMVL